MCVSDKYDAVTEQVPDPSGVPPSARGFSIRNYGQVFPQALDKCDDLERAPLPSGEGLAPAFHIRHLREQILCVHLVW